ncbi:LIM/homeobox protein Lhx9 [Aphelenchoides bicaudatus]|nr:LIM/homeobox protein Lhx9 [Aphelenchoides bicaudatus]
MIDAMLFLSTIDDCMDPMACLSQPPIQQPQPIMPECLDLRMLLGHEQLLGQIHQTDPKQPIIDNNQPAIIPSQFQNNVMSPTGPCGLCLLPIMDKNFLLIGDRSWHANCARCVDCGQLLEGHQTCYFKNDNLFCKSDYIAKFWKRCERCCDPIEPGFFIIMSKDGYYHSECFSCVICGVVLRQGDTYMIGEKSVFCQAHYESYLRTQQPAPLDMLSIPPPVSKVHEESTHPINTDKVSKRSSAKDQKAAKFSGEHSSETAYDSMDDGDNTSGQAGSKTKRMRTSFKHHQLRTMKNYFNLNHNPDAKDLKQLAQKTGLTKRVLQVWFQNARAKWRRSNTGREEGGSPAFHAFAVCSKTADIRNNSSLSTGSGIDSQSFGSITSSPKSPTENAPIVYPDNTTSI